MLVTGPWTVGSIVIIHSSCRCRGWWLVVGGLVGWLVAGWLVGGDEEAFVTHSLSHSQLTHSKLTASQPASQPANHERWKEGITTVGGLWAVSESE